MEIANQTPGSDQGNKMCHCGMCWSHRRPGRMLLGLALLVIVFSAGLVIGRMHGGHSRFGHNSFYGRGGMMGGYHTNMQYGGAMPQGMMQGNVNIQTRGGGMMRTIYYNNDATNTDIGSTVVPPNGKN